MNSEKLRELAVQELEEMKGIDIVALDVRSLTYVTDYMIIVTGRSTRHVKSLAEAVAVKAKAMKIPNVHVEGGRESDWILVDLGNVVVHSMVASARDYYSLEDLWEPVKELRDQSS